MRAEDWSAGPLGPSDAWAQPLRTAIEMALSCPRPMLVVWGQDYIGFPNDAFEALLGLRSKAHLGKPYLHQCQALSLELADVLAHVYAADHAGVRIETRGGPFEVFCAALRDRNGAVGGAFCLGFVERRLAAGGHRGDVGEGRTADADPEHALACRAARLQSSLDAARLGTWEWRPEGDVMTLDDRAREILGGWPSPTSSVAFLARVHPPDLERYGAAMDAAGGGARTRRSAAEFRWLREDSRQLWLEQTGQARVEESPAGGRAIIWSGTLRDVTERRSSEEALRAASEHKDRFLATLAHELRNPLAPLRYAAELLRSAGRDDLGWSSEVIDRQVAQLTRLVDDLFDISRITREILGIEKRPVKLTDVVQAALESCRPAIAQRQQQLIVQLPTDPIYVLGDSVRLTQVIVNLLKNASKFTGADGRVRLTAARRGAEAIVEVADTGVGIRAEDLPHVFDVFYQGKATDANTRGGLGIGLYLAKQLVELHGGTIGAGSDGPGAGSEFVLRLPVMERPEGETPAPADGAAASRATGPTCRILVVDDDADSADALARLLRLIGEEVQTAYDGDAAVDAAEQFHPHIVLLDLEMPRLDGYEACRRLRKQPSAAGALMVALSGWGRREDRARTRETGFDGHLVKPVGRADLEALLERWRRRGSAGAPPES